MSAAARHGYRQLLAQVMLDRCNSGLLVRLSWFLLVCIAGELLFSMYFGQPRFGPALLVFLICGIGYLWCGAFLKNAVRQNRPEYACLAPGLRGRLMTLTALLLAGCTLASAALAGLLTGTPGYALVCAGLLSVYLLFAQRYAALNLLPSIVILASVSTQNRPLRALLAAAETIGEPTLAGVGAIALVALGALGLRAAFPQGGDRHWEWYKSQSRHQARLRGAPPDDDADSARWTGWFRRPYLATLRRDTHGGGSQGNMMLHTLGTAAHDGTSIAYISLSTVVMVLVGRHVAGKGDQMLTLVSATLMQGCLMLSCLMYAVAASAKAARCATEQGLYCLTPAAPGPAHINRVLMRAMLSRSLRLWLASVVAAACIDFAVLGQAQSRGVTFALAMLVLPFAGLVMRNYAAMAAGSGDSMAAVLTLLVMAVYIVVVVVEQTQPAFPWFRIGAVAGLAAVAGLRLRWLRMMALPAVLPAGRLAA